MIEVETQFQNYMKKKLSFNILEVMLENLINSIELVLNQFKNIKEKEIINTKSTLGFA